MSKLSVVRLISAIIFTFAFFAFAITARAETCEEFKLLVPAHQKLYVVGALKQGEFSGPYTRCVKDNVSTAVDVVSDMCESGSRFEFALEVAQMKMEIVCYDSVLEEWESLELPFSERQRP